MAFSGTVIIAMLRVFAADESDLPWMYRLYIHAANKGHFLVADKNSGLIDIRNNLKAIVLEKAVKDLGLRAQAMVFETEQARVGYVVMSEIRAGMGGNELLMFVVDKKMRGRGYGKYMLNEVVKRWHAAANIYARCFPASSIMSDMLKKANFSNIGKNNEGADIYILPRMQQQDSMIA